MMDRALLASCLLAAPVSVLAKFEQPSFLFILGDDIGWQDFRYNNGTAASPNIQEWVNTQGTITFQDFHTGGTVCSPTRASVLTGRNPFRDCVNGVYGCSDMTECVPDFEFAPQRTFTIADAARAANKGYTSHFGGKWHLGSLYNDSEKYGGITSSPIWHGFDHMNATVEVSPTATTNCECNAEWQPNCNYGHLGKMTHCGGGPGPDPDSKPGCCFNYWWDSEESDHGVTNLTKASPDDDALYNADSFVRFAENLNGSPFMAQISFHNCHIPFVGTKDRKEQCSEKDGSACNDPLAGAEPYTDMELDFYACLNEFDNSVGIVLNALKKLGYYENTMIWFTVDNGPEVNCLPEGRCGSNSTGVIPPGTLHRPASDGPGSAGVLRGRKRDVWEGGHRVPGIVSWPAQVSGAPRESWDLVTTMDFHATVLEVLELQKPAAQANWHNDGVSIMPILKGETPAVRSAGWLYGSATPSAKNGYAFRYGNWKLVAGSVSCDIRHATFDCEKPQLYNMDNDWAENHDLALVHPDILEAITANFTVWANSVHDSIENESKCSARPHIEHPLAAPFPEKPVPMDVCNYHPAKALNGKDMAKGSAESKEACCGACKATPGCAGAAFIYASQMRPTYDGLTTGGTCMLKSAFDPKGYKTGEHMTSMQIV